MTYAIHQEAVSHALLRLLRTSHRELGGEADTVLQSRRHAGAALLERLHLIGGLQEPQVRPSLVRVRSLGHHPVLHLGEVLADMARIDPSGPRPSELLTGAADHDSDRPADLWRSVARHLLLGNHDLATSPKQPWAQAPEAAWYLLADAATTIEALVVLDQQLGYAGLLPRESTDRVLNRRLITSEVTRLAGWFGTDNSPDLACQGVNVSLRLADRPRVHMVRGIEDFVVAQQALAGFLRPSATHPSTGTERPGLLAARGLAVGQIRLADAFARWAEAHGDWGTALADSFRSRVPRYHRLHQTTLRLVEVESRRSRLVLAQQSEMIMQLRRLGSARPNRSVLVELDRATHEVTASLGKALRLETITRKNILALAESEGLGLPEPRPITNVRHPFYDACRALAEEPAPPALRVAAAPVQRERLRQALEGSVTGRARSVRGMATATLDARAAGRHRASAASRRNGASP